MMPFTSSREIARPPFADGGSGRRRGPAHGVAGLEAVGEERLFHAAEQAGAVVAVGDEDALGDGVDSDFHRVARRRDAVEEGGVGGVGDVDDEQAPEGVGGDVEAVALDVEAVGRGRGTREEGDFARRGGSRDVEDGDAALVGDVQET